MEQRKKFEFPHTYLILLSIALLIALLSYVLPASTYNMMEVAGRKVVDPETWHVIDSTPVNLLDILLAIPTGMTRYASIIFMIVMISGSIEIINKTKAIDSSIGRVALRYKNKLYILIPALMAIFVAMGALSISTATAVFVPIAIMLIGNLGGDAMAGAALVIMGANIGWTSAVFNSATTGVAQMLVGLPAYSGWQFRLVVCIVLWIVGSFVLIKKIQKVQKDPTSSLLYGDTSLGLTVAPSISEQNIEEFTLRRKLVLFVFVAGFLTIVANASKWSLEVHIPAAFLLIGIVAGVVYGFSPNTICKYFIEGASKNIGGAMIVGVAAVISIVMTNSNMIYTVVHSLSRLVEGYSPTISGVVLYLINCVINVFITSGNGQIAAAIPIFSPLADICGVSQQTMIMSVCFGDGFSNVVLPMATSTMAALAIGNIPFQKWVQYIFKWFLINAMIGLVFMVIAGVINYGPF